MIKIELTVKASQAQGEHFHTVGRGMERPGHSSAGLLCRLPPRAEGSPQSSIGLHTPTKSREKSDKQSD